MKHSESKKIHQVSRYHEVVKAVYSMIVFLTESVSVANDNVNNDVIVFVPLFCCYFHHASFIWLPGAPGITMQEHSLGGGGGVLWYFHIYVGSGKIFFRCLKFLIFLGVKGRCCSMQKKIETPLPPPPPGKTQASQKSGVWKRRICARLKSRTWAHGGPEHPK